jgi:adenylate kinase
MPKQFIFIGRSGCGKGTQAVLLLEELKKRDPSIPQLYIETGKNFRALTVSPQNWTTELIKQTIDSGGLLPDFLAVWNWGRILVDQYSGKEHLIFDGISRTKLEAEMIDTAAQYYHWEQPTVIHLAVSNEWAEDRLTARGRGDDTEEDIKRRLGWFDTDVIPALEYFKTNPRFRFREVSGERPVEAIHQEIISLI